MNPNLATYLPIYEKMRDTLSSEMHMKDKARDQNTTMFNSCSKLSARTTFDQYLRPSDGMRRSEHGYQRFCDFIYRAKYYPYPQETRDQALGMIQNEPPIIELPAQLEFMRDNATANYESLEKVMSITNSEQMVTSRVGLLLSVTGDSNAPYNIYFYKAETIIDWNVKLNEDGEKEADWVVLETGDKVDDKPVYQVLYIEQDGFYAMYKTTNKDSEYGVYGMNDDEMIPESWVQPRVKETPINKIPFVVINVQRLGYEFEKPFLEPLSDASVKLFQASARLEDNLEWGGKSTLFTQNYAMGKDERVVVGNGAVNKTSAESANAHYATAGVDGIEPSRKDVEEKKKDCSDLGVDLVNQGVESGVALAARTNIKTASLKTLAKTGAEGTEQLLKIGSEWIGANPDEVNITANTSFSDPQYTADDLVKMSMLVRNGDMSKEAFFNILKKMGLTIADIIDDEDLQKEIEAQTGAVI
jgi:hypothetical protein